MNDRFAVFINSLAPRQYCLDFIVLNTNTNSTILPLDDVFKIIIVSRVCESQLIFKRHYFH